MTGENNKKIAKDTTQIIALIMLIPMLIVSFYLALKTNSSTTIKEEISNIEIEYNKK